MGLGLRGSKGITKRINVTYKKIRTNLEIPPDNFYQYKVYYNNKAGLNVSILDGVAPLITDPPVTTLLNLILRNKKKHILF